MPSQREIIKSGRGMKKWSREELNVVRLMNKDTEFQIDDHNGDQCKIFFEIFPYTREKRNYSASHLRDQWKQRHHAGRNLMWMDVDRPSPKNKGAYTDEEREQMAVYRGWIVKAANDTGIALRDTSAMAITPADSLPYEEDQEEDEEEAESSNDGQSSPTKRSRQAADLDSVFDLTDEEEGPAAKRRREEPERHPLSGGANTVAMNNAENTLSTRTHQPIHPPSSEASEMPTPAAGEPLPMVHWRFLHFEDGQIRYEPVRSNGWRHNILIAAEGTFVDSTDKMYRYGGPVARCTYQPLPSEEHQQPQTFDTMVCLQGSCKHCRPDHPVVVGEADIKRSQFHGLPAVHRDELRMDNDIMQFKPVAGSAMTKQMGWQFSSREKVTVEDQVVFGDGKTRQVAVCAGEDCSLCFQRTTGPGRPDDEAPLDDFIGDALYGSTIYPDE
ncbi:Hypothetical predicted protein [Lecanosticta acicola]|uniref:Uncharacterized protein n=1 Tax=Lecanosticta acicola TaxID=111012 RepID=A0AAI8Z8D7_9PEZI|nr:Hypothetical predicted protein [Lecanosticta acicola]